MDIWSGVDSLLDLYMDSLYRVDGLLDIYEDSWSWVVGLLDLSMRIGGLKEMGF